MDKCRLGFSCEDLAEWLNSRSQTDTSCQDNNVVAWVQYCTLGVAVLSATLSAVAIYRQNRPASPPPSIPGNGPS